MNTNELTPNHRQYWINWQKEIDADIEACESDTELEYLMECRIDCCHALEQDNLRD